MRRLGMGLLIAGLLVALVALTLSELGAAGASTRTAANLQTMFHTGLAMCLAGVVIFLVRMMIARRGA